MLAFVRIVALLFLIACGNATKPATPPTTPPAPPPAASEAEEKFTGTITEANFGCAADARCYLVVDGKRVDFGHDSRGQTPAEWGNSDEVMGLMEDPKQGVGRKVEVFAAKNDSGYTLRGKSTYYIKVIP